MASVHVVRATEDRYLMGVYTTQEDAERAIRTHAEAVADDPTDPDELALIAWDWEILAMPLEGGAEDE